MRRNRLFKIIYLATMFFVVCNNTSGQAQLPFTYDGGKSDIIFPGIKGLTQSGLGSDYAASPMMKFDTSGDNVILNFSGVPGSLSFKTEWNQASLAKRFPGNFSLQESADGVTYSTVQSYNTTNGTLLANTITIIDTFPNLLPTSRFIKWIYSSKTNGNIGIGAISLAAGVNSVLTVSTNTLNGYNYITGNLSSTEQSFTVSGGSLTNNISVTSPVDYEISIGTAGSFIATNPITLTQSNGIVSTTTIHSRLKQGLAIGNYNENIIVSTSGAISDTISCNGTVTANPTITLTDVTNPTLNTAQGLPVTQTLDVGGVNLSADLGLSISGADAKQFSLSQYSLVPTGGIVPNTIVTITYTPSTTGSKTATLTMTSAGAMPVNRTLNGIASITTDSNSPNSLLIVTVENGNVLFNANAGETIEIYNSVGQMLLQRLTIHGLNTIQVSTRGVLLVKAGNRVAKVIL